MMVTYVDARTATIESAKRGIVNTTFSDGHRAWIATRPTRKGQ